MKLKIYRNLFILSIFIAIGLTLQFSGFLDPEKLLTLARQYTDYWWLILILIVMQAILFTFALAGSTFLWITAPLYPPEMAAFILSAGGTIGGLSAYLFSRKLTDEWAHKVENSHIYRLLQHEGGFLTLFALRVMPAFPHSLINYSSGVLNIHLVPFLLAAAIGLYIKSYVFSRVIYDAASGASLNSLLNISTFGPLLALSILLFIGLFIKEKISKPKI